MRLEQRQYTFHLNDLPNLDLQVKKGMHFTILHLQLKYYSSLSGLAEEVASRQVEALFEKTIG